MDRNQQYGPNSPSQMYYPSQHESMNVNRTVQQPPSVVSRGRPRGRPRGRKQNSARQPTNSMIQMQQQAFAAAAGQSNLPPPPPPLQEARRAKASRGGNTAARSRSQRGARALPQSQPQQTVNLTSSNPNSQTPHLAYPVPDCCVPGPFSSSSGGARSGTGLNHLDLPCLPCFDENCSATAPTTEDLMAIPVGELVPQVDSLYNFIPSGMSGCNNIDALVDFSLYLGDSSRHGENL